MSKLNCNDQSNIKEETFNRELRLLIEQSQETIQVQGNLPVELVCLNKYWAIYKTMKPSEHYQYFETLFNRNRLAILNCQHDDGWIKNTNLTIQFGEEVEDPCPKIMISKIYNVAIELQVREEKILDDSGEQFASGEGGKNLMRPSIILLHLARIFYHLTDTDDKVVLRNIVGYYEDELGVPEHCRIGIPRIPIFQSSNWALEILGIPNIMKKMGYKRPSDNEISNVINMVFNNDAI